MEDVKEKEEAITKYINLSSPLIFLDWAIVVVFFGLVFFNPRFLANQSLTIKFIIPLAVFSIFNFYVLLRPILSLNIVGGLLWHLFLHLATIFLFIWGTGGINSPFKFLFYIASVFMAGWLPLEVALTGFVAILGFPFLEAFLKDNLMAFKDPYLIIYNVALILFFWLAYNLRKEIQGLDREKENLQKLTESLADAKSKDEALLSSIADGVIAVDQQLNTVLFNKAIEGMTDYHHQEVLSKKIDEIIHFKDAEKQEVLGGEYPFNKAWTEDKSIFYHDLWLNKKGKGQVEVSASFAPIKDLRGRVTGGIAVLRDITKEKEIERMKTDFVMVTSHELRTPVTILEGYLSLILNLQVGKIDQKAKEILTKAHSAVLRMSTLVQNLLFVSKLEEKKLPYNPITFEAIEKLKEIIIDFEIEVKTKGLKLEFLSEKKKVEVFADPDGFKEIIANLLDNALKFTKKGEITISVDQNEKALFCIQDTGIGIAKENFKKIFEKFYQAESPFVREAGGTGLGLYIVKSVVEINGGKAWIESELNKGSRFCFTLPLKSKVVKKASKENNENQKENPFSGR